MVALSAYLNMMFDEGSLSDRIDRVAEAGLDGFELYGWDQDFDAITARRDAHDLEFVYMSGSRPPLTDPERANDAVTQIRESIELADRVGCQNLNVKAGKNQTDIPAEKQRENVIDVLQRVAPIADDADVTLVLEPLNTRVDHPGHFVSTAEEGAAIIEAVDSPSVRLLYDIYHEQIMAGDVIRTFQEYIDLIGHVHIADNPGRHEPGTGEINYRNVIDAIEDSDYDGFVGCEFEPSNDPDAVLRDVRSLA